MKESKFQEFPVELRQKIFELACFDDAKTGHSLSLVSKTIRSDSEPYKYQSLSICGAEQIFGFARLLRFLETQGRSPRVCRLTISNVPKNPPITKPSRSMPTIAFISNSVQAVNRATEIIPSIKERRRAREIQKSCERNRRCQEESQENERRRNQLLTDFNKIVIGLSVYLRTLHIDLSSYSFSPDPPRLQKYIHFYTLTTLTICYNVMYKTGERGLPIYRLPSLKHLHLTGIDWPYSPRQLTGDLRWWTPKLTHIRISADLASYLQPKRGLPYSRLIMDEGESEFDEPQLLPACMQRVFIQLARRCHLSWIKDSPGDEVRGYIDLERKYRALSVIDPRVVVLECDDEEDILEVIARYNTDSDG